MGLRLLYLEEVSQNRDNNFNLIRAIAATAVLVSHAYPIALGPEAKEPLQDLTGYSLGSLSVYVFFAISGFLITASFERSSSVASFLSARILRLVPGLAVSLLLVAFVLGPVVTTLPLGEYLSNPEVYRFLGKNMALIWPEYYLPGVFETNPYPAIEGSIWTLFHEVVCYMGVLVIGLFGVLQRRGAMVAAVGLYLVFWAIGEFSDVTLPSKIEGLRRLSMPFAIGVIFYVWKANLPLSVWVLGGLCAVTFGLRDTAAYDLLLIISLSYGTFWLAYIPKGVVRGYNRIGDYSYGIYIYAFPMQGAAVWAFGSMSPLENMLIAFPLTLLPSILSWHLLEEPALGLRKVMAAKLKWRQIRS